MKENGKKGRTAPLYKAKEQTTVPSRPSRPQNLTGNANDVRGQKNGPANAENTRKEEKNASGTKRMGAKLKLLIAFSAVALVFIICAAVNIAIGVREIDVKGVELCTRDEILAVAGIEEGSGYFSYNTSAAEKRIKEVYPCVSDIKISRSVFGKVTVTVTEEKALWYIESYSEYFALSADLGVIKVSDSRNKFIDLGLVRLDFPEIRSAALGKPLEIRDDDRDCAYVLDLLRDVSKTNLYRDGRLDQIRIKNKFEVFLVIDCKHLVSIGNCSGIEDKLDRVENVLAENSFDWSKKTEITVTGTGSPSVRENSELDFSYLLSTNLP